MQGGDLARVSEPKQGEEDLSMAAQTGTWEHDESLSLVKENLHWRA